MNYTLFGGRLSNIIAIVFIIRNIFKLNASGTVSPGSVLIYCGVGLTVWAWSFGQAFALEKNGRPLPSMEEQRETAREAEEHLFEGYFLTGAVLSNPTFAARPDNTGLAGLRHMMHLETDLYKKYLSFYTDQTFFSDRTEGWIKLTEWDEIYALTGLVDRGGWRLQYERDAPLDRSGIKQIYGDTLLTGRTHASRRL